MLSRSISIIGAGISGISCAEFALKLGYKVFLSEISNKDIKIKNNKNLKIETGQHSDEILNSNYIILSPGIPQNIEIIEKAKRKKIPIINEIEFGSWFCEHDILAITGSNGKSTTCLMLHEILVNNGYQSYLGGNFGIPFTKNLIRTMNNKSDRIVHVLELSSFQIELLSNFKSDMSCILNISQDHLDRYINMESYVKTKLKILKFSKKSFYNNKDINLKKKINSDHNQNYYKIDSNTSSFRINNRSIVTKSGEILFNLEETNFVGDHNLQNAISACTLAFHYGVDKNSISQSIKKIKPLNHRIEYIGQYSNVKYYNDSKSTNLNSTIKAIKSFEKNVILILGGQNKGFDFSELKSFSKKIKLIFCYGDSGLDISESLHPYFKTYFKSNFRKCIIEAVRMSSENDNILLSPGCSSYDQFDNFEKRGDSFKKIISEIHYV